MPVLAIAWYCLVDAMATASPFQVREALILTWVTSADLLTPAADHPTCGFKVWIQIVSDGDLTALWAVYLITAILALNISITYVDIVQALLDFRVCPAG